MTCKMLVNFYLLLIFLVISIKESRGDSSFLNRAIDSIISEKVKKSDDNELDPIHIPDTGFEFRRRVAILEVHGVAKFTNITFSGLSGIHRSRDVQAETLDNKKIMTIFMGVENLKTEMEGILKFMGYGVRRSFNGLIPDLEAKLILNLDTDVDDLKVSVFKIEKMSSLKLTASGSFRVVDAVTNQVLSIATENFQKIFRYAIELALMKIADQLMTDSSAIKRVMMSVE